MATDGPTLRLFLENWSLFRDPIVVGIVAGGVLGCLGIYILARRMVFASAAFTQAAGLGVAFAFGLQRFTGGVGWVVEPRLWAILMALFAAWALGRSWGRGYSREGFLALAYLVGGAGILMLGTRLHQDTHDIDAILFGTGVLVGPEDLVWVCLIGGITLALQLWWRRGFLFASLDPEGAKVRAIPVGLLDGLLMLQIAAMVSVATRALGALPVFGFSILPALAASLVVKSPLAALLLAGLFGAVGGLAGYVLAFFGQFPVGATQTLVSAIPVMVALALRVSSKSVNTKGSRLQRS